MQTTAQEEPRREAHRAAARGSIAPSRAMRRVVGLAAVTLLACAPACGESDENEPDPQGASGGAAGSAGVTGAAGAAPGLTPFTPPADPGAGGFLVTISGEAASLAGFPFEPGVSRSEDPAFVDGWEVRFEHLLLTVGGVTLHETPDADPADKTKLGKQVAEARGPWAVDLAKGGPLIGKGGPGEQAVALAAMTGAFDASSRYGVAWETARATVDARNVNLDAAAVALYLKAVERGWSVLVTGKATYRGAAPPAGTVFAKLPTEVTFSVGLSAPARMLNCENPELGKSALGEEFARGVQPSPTASSVLQLTWHAEHLFWGALEEEHAPMHFDPWALRSPAYGVDAVGAVTIDDLTGADFTFLRSKTGDPLPARSLVPDHAPLAGTLGYSAGGVTIPMNDLAAYLRVAVAESGHLNANGECATTLLP